MLIVGQAGSGPKDRTDRPLREEKGREESSSREVGHAGNCAGQAGAGGPVQSGSAEPGEETVA